MVVTECLRFLLLCFASFVLVSSCPLIVVAVNCIDARTLKHRRWNMEHGTDEENHGVISEIVETDPPKRGDGCQQTRIGKQSSCMLSRA